MCYKLVGPILQLLYMMLEMKNWQILDVCPEKKQICETFNSKILVMCQPEENLWGFMIENFTQYNSSVKLVYTVF